MKVRRVQTADPTIEYANGADGSLKATADGSVARGSIDATNFHALSTVYDKSLVRVRSRR